jgi:hypothetical protein
MEENMYFSTCPPPTSIHLSHRFTSVSRLTAYESFDCCQFGKVHRRFGGTYVYIFGIEERLAYAVLIKEPLSSAMGILVFQTDVVGKWYAGKF